MDCIQTTYILGAWLLRVTMECEAPRARVTFLAFLAAAATVANHLLNALGLALKFFREGCGCKHSALQQEWQELLRCLKLEKLAASQLTCLLQSSSFK